MKKEKAPEILIKQVNDMPLVQWSDDLSLHIPSIDQQHRKLFDLVNHLHDEIQKKEKGEKSEAELKTVIESVLDDLSQYVIKHFAYEEGLLDENKYLESKVHKEEHEVLMHRLVDLQVDIDDDQGNKRAEDLLEFLKDWLTCHIQLTDKKYASFLISKGVR